MQFVTVRQQLQPIQRLIQFSLALLWIYQGLIPKLLIPSPFEIQVWQFMGLESELATITARLSGIVEILFGCIFLLWQRSRWVHYLNIVGLLGLLLLCARIDPVQLIGSFNPMIMNGAMLVLSLLAIQLLQLEQTLPEP